MIEGNELAKHTGCMWPLMCCNTAGNMGTIFHVKRSSDETQA